MKGLQQLRRYVEPCDYTTNKFRVTQLLRFGTVCGFTKCFNLRRVVFVKTAEEKLCLGLSVRWLEERKLSMGGEKIVTDDGRSLKQISSFQ